MRPLIQYARSIGGVRIAYSTVGNGPPVVLMPVLPASHLELEWDLPGRGAWYTDMAQSFTLVRYDGRGSGLSDRDVDDLTFSAHMADLKAVVDALGTPRFSLVARHIAGPIAMSFAAENPERLNRLILWHTFARVGDFSDLARTQAIGSLLQGGWDLFTEMCAYASLGWPSTETARQFAAYTRSSIGQSNYIGTWQGLREIDCSDILPMISTPTLIFHRRSAPKFDVEVSSSLASLIPNARLILVEGASSAFFGEDMANITESLSGFLRHGFGECGALGAPPSMIHQQSGLTNRETEILRLLSSGRHNKEIAQDLALSVHTIDRHLANIYNKIGAHNRVEAAAFALRRGIA
jgi:DNA-binding CsgD family transcriptional regulator/pimeloyl-ACP methyl ester carboxylesterase